MEIYKVIILAIEQGITELLPISSTAHLILTGKLINIPTDTYILAVLHLGTTIAIIIYFLPTLLKDIFHKDTLTFYAKIVVATIPAAIMGLLFESVIENVLRGDLFIAIFVIEQFDTCFCHPINIADIKKIAVFAAVNHLCHTSNLSGDYWYTA